MLDYFVVTCVGIENPPSFDTRWLPAYTLVYCSWGSQAIHPRVPHIIKCMLIISFILIVRLHGPIRGLLAALLPWAGWVLVATDDRQQSLSRISFHSPVFSSLCATQTH